MKYKLITIIDSLDEKEWQEAFEAFQANTLVAYMTMMGNEYGDVYDELPDNEEILVDNDEYIVIYTNNIFEQILLFRKIMFRKINILK